MISINATLFVQVLHFLILTFILNRLMFRPIMRLVKDRTRYIEKTEKEIVNIESETTQLVSKCISMENDTRKDAGEERSQFKKEASKIAENIFQDTKNEVAVIREEVDKNVERQLEAAQKFLHSEAVVLADEITKKIIGRRVGD
ncbi:MAG: hypothetical protein SV375_03990 [Thermodesulfobacteriota bacterium]|nr:hypothetical protein [Thermodesulfobacteriota bacterium]